MSFIATTHFASSHSSGPAAAALRRFFRGVRRHFPITSRRQGYLELARGYERMASRQAAAGADAGARYYWAHARAIREALVEV